MSEARLHQWTLPEFLAWEERQERKYEFVGGEPRLMTGVSQAHAMIVVNVGAMLRNALRNSSCRTSTSDLRVLTGTGNSRYPDAVVDCGPFRPDSHEASEPVTVFEVLSRSTAWTDLHDRLRDYDATPTIRQYVVVAQDEPKLVMWERDPSNRLVLGMNIEGLRGELAPAPGGATLRVEEIYEGLGFEPESVAL